VAASTVRASSHPFRRRTLLLAPLFALALMLPLTQSASAGERPRVLAVEFTGTVNPVTKDFLVGEIKRAERDGYAAIVLLTDTPGGLDASMREIIKAELAARLPVVLYVYPAGARAASAGVFLTMAADVAAMAPQTNIGSATPVSVSGEAIPEDARRKVVNDAAAYIRSLADEHGRNGTWAESAVRKGANLPARAALAQRVVDVVAPDLPTLLAQLDGSRTVPKGLVLHTAGAEVEHVEMSLWKRILNTAIDPNIVVLLLSLGALGILIELWNPGLILPGAVGAISLLLGLFGLQVLPVSWAGVLLMLLALAFFVAEALVTSFGALALAGAVSFFFGALMLFDPAGEAFRVSVPVALAVGGTLALATAVALTKAAQAPPGTAGNRPAGAGGKAWRRPRRKPRSRQRRALACAHRSRAAPARRERRGRPDRGRPRAPSARRRAQDRLNALNGTRKGVRPCPLLSSP
jgi:membrane-bound serine protease (ClpP class)